ncbi:cytochrome c oxidase subunit 4 [Xylanimonas oleitrophica]|uniref:Cytochrome c oxidase polypeptide 4 n=1 Tax=Xylanimonas oleitrophica TaxID=2607479 RepID=A0A2W5X0L4_9MICO|nr:cytochrome c oxidase subunit 4 [Xylanimonas oleitrophica]PZR53785.1 cytochrome c oxidase subunit 4 [Xylanimonas oleitrophica]
MKIEVRLFIWLTPFFLVAGVVYGVLTGWDEPVGYLGIPLVGALMAMIGAYLALTARRIDPRPEDDENGDIEQGAGDQGVFAPWSWWPLVIGAASSIVFLGLAVGWWVLYIGFIFSVIGLIGWVFEFSRGRHAH